MIIFPIKSKHFYAYGLILTLLFSCIQTISAEALTAENVNECFSEVIPSSDEEKQWIERNMKKTIDIIPNKIGSERINESKKSKGLPDPPGTNPVDVGGTVVSEGDSPNAISSSDLPDYVDNSKLPYYPALQSQGPLSSCAAFSTTYYQVTYMTALAKYLNIKNDNDYSKIFSPKWTYNFINKGKDTGSSLSSAYTLLKEQGAATWSNFPYNNNYDAATNSKNYTEWPTDSKTWENAANNRVDNMGYLQIYKSDTETPITNPKDPILDNMKKLLVNGYILVSGFYKNSGHTMLIKNNPNSTSDDEYVNSPIYYAFDGYSGGHAEAIVGYNDTIWTDIDGDGEFDDGEFGAFKLQDGTWVSYDALNKLSAIKGLPVNSSRTFGWMDNNCTFWITVNPSYTPALLGELTLNHSKRDQLKYAIGYSEANETNPTITWWTPEILNRENGAYSFDGSNTASDGVIVIDYTNLISNQALSDTTKRWYMKITDTTGDGNACIIKDFKLVDPIANYTVHYNNPIKSIDGDAITLSIDYKLRSNTVADPAFSIGSGTYKYAKKVTINCETTGAAIKYTTNGDIPTLDSPTYQGPVNIYGNMTLKAIAVKPNFNNSSVVSADYNAGHLIGDLNGDGKINILDISLLTRYVNKYINTFPISDGLFVADINGDGVIDQLDLNLMKKDQTSCIKKDLISHIIGDVNDDEKVDNKDLFILNQYVNKKISVLPVTQGLWAGDVNGDNIIDSNDIEQLNEYISGKINLFPKQRHNHALGDVNGDGNVNILDFQYMKKYINNYITSFPIADDLWTGDLNGDSVIDNSDHQLLKQYILDKISYFKKERVIHNIGDVNGDNIIDSKDFDYIQNFANGLIDSFPVSDILWTGDVNGDNIIDLKDADLVKQYISGQITVFPKS